jgi:type IV pilus assembly protein PilM
MTLFGNIARLIQDPPPEFVFELSEAGIAFARGGETGFAPLDPGVLKPSPVDDNLPHPERAAAALQRIAEGGGPAGAAGKTGGKSKPRRTAMILPDHAARVSVLDFDSFPSGAAEQLALVRFRVKKTVPFDIDSAAVSYFAQPAAGGGKHKDKERSKRHEVVAVSVALEVLARYEALLRSAGFHPGEITTSALAALSLYPQPADRGEAPGVLAKLAGNILTVMVIAGGRLRLFRCVALEEASDEEIRSVLQPTLAYAEDEMGARVGRLTVCGLSHAPLHDVPVEPLRSSRGNAGAFNAGLLGYLEDHLN